MSIIIKEEKTEVKCYLLGQLTAEDEERLELRLLTDPAFGEEFDTVVDEITDQYVGNEFQGEERKRVEQYFLRSAERQNKARFTSELFRQAAVERGGKVIDASVQSEPGIWDRVCAFWNRQSLSLRFAMIFATLIIVLGVVMLVIPSRGPTSPAYASIALKASNSERSTGSEITSIRPEPGIAGIRIELALPEEMPETKNYRVNLSSEQVSRDLPVAEQNERSIVVVVPAEHVPRGSYVIRLFAVNADGSEQRVRGSYFFNVE